MKRYNTQVAQVMELTPQGNDIPSVVDAANVVERLTLITVLVGSGLDSERACTLSF